jgi:RNA polymerase sigma factor (sigma-70 family)
MQHADLKEIINGCKQNKEKYQELLYRQFYGYVMAIALRYSGDKEEALEILNDTFMKVFKNISQHESVESFKSWLAKIAVNTAIDYTRKNKKISKLEDLSIAKNEINEDENIYHQFSLAHILTVIQQLPPYCRLVFNMYVIEGYSHKEIGDLLGITDSTSRANLANANTKLRAILKKGYKEYEK